ncbi:MAG: suppressor of fused domain protein [Peptostreptococcaceae bacterium]|jgi:hypothetical protein|nr:suppressor of fused domain protein [Peptostreptococcaceae bacterium]
MRIFKKLFKKTKKPKTKDERRKLNYKIRGDFWSDIGDVDEDVLAPLINPAFFEGAMWPDLRQCYKKLSKNDYTIVYTDGLSDEFKDSTQGDNGFEIELYVEVKDKDLKGKNTSELKSSWPMQILYQTAMNAANIGRFKAHYEEHGVFSMELYDIDVPKQFINKDGRVGVLIGMNGKHVKKKLNLSSKEVYMLSITLLTSDELEYIVKNGKEARLEVVKLLKLQSFCNVSSIKRESVLIEETVI